MEHLAVQIGELLKRMEEKEKKEEILRNELREALRVQDSLRRELQASKEECSALKERIAHGEGESTSFRELRARMMSLEENFDRMHKDMKPKPDFYEFVAARSKYDTISGTRLVSAFDPIPIRIPHKAVLTATYCGYTRNDKDDNGAVLFKLDGSMAHRGEGTPGALSGTWGGHFTARFHVPAPENEDAQNHVLTLEIHNHRGIRLYSPVIYVRVDYV